MVAQAIAMAAVTNEGQCQQPRGQHEQRNCHQVVEPNGTREPSADEVTDESRHRRHHKRLVVDVRTEASLSENRFVEQADARSHESVEGSADRKNMERRSAQSFGQ